MEAPTWEMVTFLEGVHRDALRGRQGFSEKYIFILWKPHLAQRKNIRHFNFRSKEKREIGLSVLRVKTSRHLESSYSLR